MYNEAQMPIDAAKGGSFLASLEPSSTGCTHAVQFYEAEGYLFSVVAEFLEVGLAAGRGGLIVATAEHREAFAKALRSRGVKVDAMVASGRLALLDARETLDRFTVAGRINSQAFEKVMSEVLSGLGGPVDEPVCVFGEMVDLLWQDGKPDEAILLEDFWNSLTTARPFSLLCAYPIGGFSNVSDSDPFLEICRSHQHILPTERYLVADDPARALEISRLQQRAQALESEIENRTLLEGRLRESLAEKELLLESERHARADAEEANRAKRDFLATMSHELRTPLNAISGYAELLELGVPGPICDAQRDYLERIQRSQRRLLTLIDEVLVYARTESGRTRYTIGEVQVAEVLRAADLAVLPQMREKEIEYTYSVSDISIVARADRDKLQQIIVKLLANASKFTDPGGSIRVECEATSQNVFIHVHDTGIGIPKEKIDEIFKPFVQVDSRLSRAHEGAGLGLAISREFARGMGGDLEISRSGPDGSTFSLILPRG